MKPSRDRRRRRLLSALRLIRGAAPAARGPIPARVEEMGRRADLRVPGADALETLVRVLPPSHTPPELVAILAGLLPVLLGEDARLAGAD